MIKPGRKFGDGGGGFDVREVFTRHGADLDFLSLSEVNVSCAATGGVAFPEEEVLLFNLGCATMCLVDEREYRLEHYDVVYIPASVGFSFRRKGNEAARLYAYRAFVGSSGGQSASHPVFHSSFEAAKSDEARIRRLDRKIVYKMFDVDDSAEKLIAGYTFYEDHTRAWPPHNHTDQEEVYSFIEGNGAMTVYEDESKQTFVTSVGVGDHVTIPVLNYHPVFSDDEAVTFIWCIAGERYWVGDKNTEFMKGGAGKITT